MKYYSLTAIATAALLALGSCIGKEPLNAEADIEKVTLAGDVLNRAPIIENDKVTLVVKYDVDITRLAPEFTLTPGATIEPPSGTVRNFTTPQTYEVTSEDRHWHKTYTVDVSYANLNLLEYNFDHVRLYSAPGGRYSYDIFYEVDLAGREVLTWASGNPGFALTGEGKEPDSFPTYQVDNGHGGKALALTTRRTGGFGALVNKPLAAGNLFIGSFDMNMALAHPLEATRFGTPFTLIPTYIRGRYRYKAGETFYNFDASTPDKLTPVPGKKDEFNIYATFFESTADMQMLDGTNATSIHNPNIIATAIIPANKRVEASEWTEFYIPFTYREGKTIDPEKLASGRYSITIVFSSSIDGDTFEGAPGSTLLIDNVQIGCVTEN